MATIRTALRLRSGAQPLRSSRLFRATVLAHRTYATPSRRPATAQKPVEEAEEAQEDLSDGEDPNMVGILGKYYKEMKLVTQ